MAPPLVHGNSIYAATGRSNEPSCSLLRGAGWTRLGCLWLTATSRGYAGREHSTPLRDYGEALQELGNSEVELAHGLAHKSHHVELEAPGPQSISGS